MEHSQGLSGSRSSARCFSAHGAMAIASACTESSPQREALEQYISAIFSAAYDARILEYLPLLFSLEQDQRYSAALGLRSASVGPLFSEQYMDSAVEDEVLALYGVQVRRRSIMEMGNLVASSAGQSVLLYLLVIAALHEAGVGYLLFAANKAVRASIRRSGFTPKILCVAEQDRLGAQARNWGAYYQGEPFVMLADVSLGMEQAMAQPVMRKVIAAYRHAIPVLADSIRKHGS